MSEVSIRKKGTPGTEVPGKLILSKLFFNFFIRPISPGFDYFPAYDFEILQCFKMNLFTYCGNSHTNTGVYPLK